ncbi:hypothetical protein AB0J82_36295 [Asanoa sp. NPDC049518]|uniref:hypothetical protein n=1 Tax=unclassified Asanoa TaxID=2685164 RepID=UPI00343F2216
MAELLDGVSEIDWSALDHAYGSAERVPLWLAAMTDPATSADALSDLDAAVYHQGGAVYSAGAAVVPFLIRFAMDTAVPERVDILELLTRFAALHNQMREPWTSRPAALACRTALLAAFDGLRRLLDEPDPAIRGGVVEILVELGERADDVVHELIRRIPGETDPTDYVLALGTVGGNAAAAWLARNTPPPGDPRRLAFLVAARRIDREAVPAEEMLAARRRGARTSRRLAGPRDRVRPGGPDSTGAGGHDAVAPTRFQLCQVLSAFGAAALPAQPELTALLESDQPRLACTVLGGLGPAASDARPTLSLVAGRDGRGAAAAV